MLLPAGGMLISFPIGHNASIDQAMQDGTLDCADLRCMKRIMAATGSKSLSSSWPDAGWTLLTVEAGARIVASKLSLSLILDRKSRASPLIGTATEPLADNFSSACHE
jgi:hypothetical protein